MFPETDIYGMPIVINDYMGNESEFRQIRFPRSKKKRIRKKWSKNRANWKLFRWQEPVSYVFAGKQIIMNSTAYSALKKELNAKTDSRSADPIQRAADGSSGISMMLADMAASLGLPAGIVAADRAETNYSSAWQNQQIWKTLYRPQ